MKKWHWVHRIFIFYFFHCYEDVHYFVGGHFKKNPKIILKLKIIYDPLLHNGIVNEIA